MPQHRYDIRFGGKLIRGSDPRIARRRVQQWFRLSDDAVDLLFSGEKVTIKRAVDRDTASFFRERFRDAGAEVEIVALPQEEVPAPQANLSTGTEAQAEMPELGVPEHADPLELLVEKVFHYFEKTLAGILLILISAVSVIAVVELCLVLYKDISSQRSLLLSLDELFEVFGMFLIVLIAIELMASVYMYVMDKSVHVEFMLLIAITALTRKVVVIDLEAKSDDPLYLIGLAALLGILVGGYYLVRGQFVRCRDRGRG